MFHLRSNYWIKFLFNVTKDFVEQEGFKMKNRILSLVVTAGMVLGMLTGCGSSASKNDAKDKEKESASYSIVCTTYPQYDWVCNILGDLKDKFKISYLMDNGVDLHSYQASAEDMATIGAADLFIYVGGESDGWVDDALKNATNKDIDSVNMVKALGDSIKEEEVVEGMQAEEEEEEDGEEEVEYDEHVWLSLKNAKKLVNVIAEKIEKIDPKDADQIADQAAGYNTQLDNLDTKYQEVVKNGSCKTVVFGDRFPFRYLVDDYNLKYYAAFVGCSAETEASFKTITFLAKKVDEEKLGAILTIERSDQKIAKTIRKNTESKDQKILTLDSLQSVSKDDIDGGKSYLKAMEENLDVLKEALN